MTADHQPLTDEQIAMALPRLSGWRRDGAALTRRIECKGFAPAMMAANLAAVLSERMNHHADIRLGWGYCELRWTSHDAGALTARDLTAAERFNAAYDGV